MRHWGRRYNLGGQEVVEAYYYAPVDRILRSIELRRVVGSGECVDLVKQYAIPDIAAKWHWVAGAAISRRRFLPEEVSTIPGVRGHKEDYDLFQNALAVATCTAAGSPPHFAATAGTFSHAGFWIGQGDGFYVLAHQFLGRPVMVDKVRDAGEIYREGPAGALRLRLIRTFHHFDDSKAPALLEDHAVLAGLAF